MSFALELYFFGVPCQKKPSGKLATFPAGNFLEFSLALYVHLAEAL